MESKLWTSHFVRVCLANLLLFVSLYMLYPVLPVVMAGRLGIPVSETGFLYLFFAVGMLLVGPFHNYLVDAYKRKYVCMLSFALMTAAVAGYAFVRNLAELQLLCLVQGAAFGLTTTAGITLGIDVINSSFRSAGNQVFSWAARLGMILGIAAGVFLYRTYDFESLLYLSVAMGALGILTLSGVYAPFRAPIVTNICSFDRFLLLRGLVPALNLMFIAFVPGMLLPMLLQPQSPVNVLVGGIPIPFFGVACVGFLLTVLLVRLFFRGKNKMWIQIVAGLVLMIGAIVAMSQVILPQVTELVLAAILFGLSLGLIAPEFLNMFVKLSEHCQRGTANTMHLLAWEIGIALGIATACSIRTDASQEVVYQVGMFSAVLALVFFALVTYPYFKVKKKR